MNKSDTVASDAPLSNLGWFRHAKARANEWQVKVERSPANGSNRRMVALWEHQATLTYARMTEGERNILRQSATL